MLCLTRPDVIAGMHEAFFAVGVDAIETASFGAFATVLTEYDVGDRAHELNVAAARIAREVADGFSADGRTRYVAGSIGPGTKLPSLGHVGFAELRDAYHEQAHGLLEGGVDLFIVETCMDLLQVKAAMLGCRRAMHDLGRAVPMQVQVTIESTGRMLVGSEIGAALVSVAAMRPDVLGINCATGPAEMQEHLRYLSKHSPLPISVLPNAGLPSIVDGRTCYDLTPEQLADYHRRHVAELGVSIVGGCCGTTPEHLRQVVEAVHGVEPRPGRRPWNRASRRSTRPVPIEQDLSFLIIGERTNANGSKAFREAMLAGDWDTCTKMANEQVREGAHVLDVCVDYVGRDGAVDMDEIAKRFATQASAPLVSTRPRPQVMEAGLQHIGGRAILNSANLEDGELPGSRLDRVMSARPRLRRGGDLPAHRRARPGPRRRVEDGDRPPHPRDRHRALRAVGERPDLRHADVPALDRRRRPARATRSTRSRRSGGSRPRSPAPTPTLGVSNVSFGLNPAARHALNSVFLHECVEAGLDSAIVHAGKIVPLNRLPDEQREVCLDLVLGPVVTRRLRPARSSCSRCSPTSSRRRPRSPTAAACRCTERLHHRIIDGDRDGLTDDLDEAMASGLSRARHRQRRPPRGDEGGRRALRIGPDAAPVRPPVGGDDEDRRRLPRAAHGAASVAARPRASS